MSKPQILALLKEQFAEISERLDTQLLQTVGLQEQIDAHYRETERLREQVRQIHDLLKGLVTDSAEF